MGRMFGPVTLVWFVTLALLGVRWIVTRPDVLFAINPLYAVHFFIDNGVAGFVTLAVGVPRGDRRRGAVCGHGPLRPRADPARLVHDRAAGAGAELLRPGRAAAGAIRGAIANPFYLLAPGWLLPLLIVLATAATVIASQAVISGVFSVTRQALNLGYLPRLRVLHSSEEEIGQVYVPTVNWMLFVGHDDADRRVPLLERAGRRVRHRHLQHDADRQHPGDHAAAGPAGAASPRW